MLHHFPGSVATFPATMCPAPTIFTFLPLLLGEDMETPFLHICWHLAQHLLLFFAVVEVEFKFSSSKYLA